MKQNQQLSNETLFWKVFRNIVLFKHIFSKLNNKQYGYYDLSISDHFLNDYSNVIEIIIDNIKSNNNNNNKINNHNHNHNNHQIIKNKFDILRIIKNIKKNNEITKSFYNLLFKTYSKTQSIQFDQQANEWIFHIIESSNFVALDQYFKYFKINLDEIKKCLPLHFYQDYFFIFFEGITYNTFKIYNYLKLNGCIDESYFKESLKEIGSLNEYLSFNNKFKKLIKSYNLVIQFINQQHQQHQQQPQQHQQQQQVYEKYGNKFYKLVLELNEIQSNQFTNDQLNSTVREILKNNQNNGSGGGLNEIIKKYLKSIYLFFNHGKEKYQIKSKLPYSYYIYFKNKNYDNDEIVKKIENSNFIEECEWVDLFEKRKNDKLELALNILNSNDMKIGKTQIFKFNSFIKFIFSSNDKELIEPVLDKLLNLQQNQQLLQLDTSFSEIIIDNLHRIKNKEILDLLYNNDNFRTECGLFNTTTTSTTTQDNSNHWLEDRYDFSDNLTNEIIEYYENLLSKLGIKYNFENSINNWNYFQVLNRVILKPSVYSFDFNNFEFNEETIFESLSYPVKDDLIIEFLSNAQLKRSINLDSFINQNSIYIYKTNNSFYNFLFQNISKETISNKINENNLIIDQTGKCLIELTATIIDSSSSSSSSSSDSSSKSGKEYNNIIIGKTKSFNFSISINSLLLCLYHMGRIDDIVYIFDTTPNVSFAYNMFDLKTTIGNLYNSFSIYYLELFINYFINYIRNNNNNNNNNNNSYNHGINLYYCLSVASSKGFIQIFKNIISSSPENSKLLLNIKKESNQSTSLFELRFLKDLVLKSIDSNMVELSNLLIQYIDFSKEDKDELKTELLNSILLKVYKRKSLFF